MKANTSGEMEQTHTTKKQGRHEIPGYRNVQHGNAHENNSAIAKRAKLILGTTHGGHILHEWQLDAKKWAHASWSWLSILQDRDFLHEEGIWKIGNGEKIKVFTDSWILRIRDHRIRKQRNNAVNRDLRIAELLKSLGKRWSLRQIQNEEERIMI